MSYGQNLLDVGALQIIKDGNCKAMKRDLTGMPAHAVANDQPIYVRKIFVRTSMMRNEILCSNIAVSILRVSISHFGTLSRL